MKATDTICGLKPDITIKVIKSDKPGILNAARIVLTHFSRIEYRDPPAQAL